MLLDKSQYPAHRSQQQLSHFGTTCTAADHDYARLGRHDGVLFEPIVAHTFVVSKNHPASARYHRYPINVRSTTVEIIDQ